MSTADRITCYHHAQAGCGSVPFASNCATRSFQDTQPSTSQLHPVCAPRQLQLLSPRILMSNLLVIYNPVCGAHGAQKVFDDQVIPLLKQHGKSPDKIVVTTHAGHAGEAVVDYLTAHPGPLTLVLGSGDGTLHEIVVALHDNKLSLSLDTEIKVVLVPCGTANALYWSIFPPSPDSPQQSTSPSKALDAFLSSNATRPLTFAVTSFHSQLDSLLPQSDVTRTSVAAVVTSTSLHASILHDSEALRASHPGIERFKLAAQQNISRWYHAQVRLYPSATQQSIEIYDPRRKSFRHWDSEGMVTLHGPFVYFLSTVNVDRLEAAFRITPLHNPGSAGSSMDVVMIRPRRDAKIIDEEEASRQAFAERTQEVLMGAYQDGAHIDMQYGAQGGEGSESILEYFRCGRWEWIPVSGQCNPGHYH